MMYQQNNRHRFFLLALAVSAVVWSPTLGEETSRAPSPEGAPSSERRWFGDLERAKEVANKSRRPIMMVFR